MLYLYSKYFRTSNSGTARRRVITGDCPIGQSLAKIRTPWVETHYQVESRSGLRDGNL
jgi:hypothetical protein